MKKFVALLLALTLCIGLCACGAQPEAPAATDDHPNTPSKFTSLKVTKSKGKS